MRLHKNGCSALPSVLIVKSTQALCEQQPAKRMKIKLLASRRSELTNDPEKDLSSSIPQRKNPRRKPAGSITKPVQVTKSKKKSR
jgi:hypothetical protein